MVWSTELSGDARRFSRLLPHGRSACAGAGGAQPCPGGSRERERLLEI